MQRDENKTKPPKQNKTHQNRTQWQRALEGALLVLAEHTCISTSYLQGRQLQGGAPGPGLSQEQEQTAFAPEFLWNFSD